MLFGLRHVKAVKAYNGKRGCMCGCLGNYTEDQNSIAFKRRVNKVENFIGPIRPDSNDAVSYSTAPFGGLRYFNVTEGDRTTCVYFTDY